MQLHNYIEYLGWSTSDLASKAKINRNTARRALARETIHPRTAQKIAAALTVALGTSVQPGDIEDLHIERK